MRILPFLVGWMLATSAIASEPGPDDGALLPLAVDVRLGGQKSTGDVPQRPYLGGELSFRLPSRLWLRGASWTRMSRFEDLDQDLAYFLANEGVYDAPETWQWRESHTALEAAWESQRFGPQLWLRVGVSGAHFSNQQFGALLREESSESGGSTLWSEAGVNAGPVLALGGDYSLGPAHLEPHLVLSHRRPMWAKSGFSDEELSELEGETDISLPRGFLDPETILEARLTAVVWDVVSAEVAVRQSWQGLSDYDVWLSKNQEIYEVAPSSYRTIEVRVGARFGARNSTSAPASASVGDTAAGIQKTGIAELDELFTKVEELRVERGNLHSAIVDARRSLDAVAARTEVGTARDLLSGLANGSLDVGLQLRLEGGRPKLVPSGNLAGDSQDIALAFEALVVAVVEVQQRVPKLVEQSKALVEQANALAQRAPEIFKTSGLSPLKVPVALGALKDNVQVSARLPQEFGETLSEAAGVMSLLKGTVSPR